MLALEDTVSEFFRQTADVVSKNGLADPDDRGRVEKITNGLRGRFSLEIFGNEQLGIGTETVQEFQSFRVLRLGKSFMSLINST
ncbi:MAG: hypothetical protein AMXMBFR16_01820 [Candidatus Uhrbacteria bacterium]|nr:MAG: hypothetical protein DCC77_00735 [Candidatus Uhrbacteria bacterium]